MPFLPWFMGKTKMPRTSQCVMWLGHCSLWLEGRGDGGTFLMAAEGPERDMAHRLGDGKEEELGVLGGKRLCLPVAVELPRWAA